MRFSLISALVPALVAGDSVSSLLHGYSTIPCSNTAELNSLIANLSGHLDSHYKSMYGMTMPTTATDSVHTSMATGMGMNSVMGGGVSGVSSGPHNDHSMTDIGQGTGTTVMATATTGTSGNSGNSGNSGSGAPIVGTTLTFTGMAGQPAPFFLGTGGFFGVAIAGFSVLFI